MLLNRSIISSRIVTTGEYKLATIEALVKVETLVFLLATQSGRDYSRETTPVLSERLTLCESLATLSENSHKTILVHSRLHSLCHVVLAGQ